MYSFHIFVKMFIHICVLVGWTKVWFTLFRYSFCNKIYVTIFQKHHLFSFSFIEYTPPLALLDSVPKFNTFILKYKSYFDTSLINIQGKLAFFNNLVNRKCQLAATSTKPISESSDPQNSNFSKVRKTLPTGNQQQ